MKTPQFRRPYALALCAFLFPSVTPAAIVDFEYVKIAQTGDAFTGGTLATLGDFDFEGGSLSFLSSSSIGPGVFSYSSGAISVVATTSTTVPGLASTFQTFANPSVSDGVVAFRGLYNSTSAGIFTTRTGSLRTVATLNTASPANDELFTNLYFGSFHTGSATDIARGMNSGISHGTMVFGGTTNSGFGIYVSPTAGVIRTVGTSADPVRPFGSGSIDGDSVVFNANTDAGRGVFRYSISGQSITPVVAPGTVFPNGALPAQVIGPSVSGNSVAFNVETSFNNLTGIYVADSTGTHLIADGSTPVPNFTGTFVTGTTGLGSLGLSISNGNVAFLGPRTAGGIGIYSTLGGSLSKVISTDDSLLGKSVSGLAVGVPKIDGPNVAFVAQYSGGGTGLFVAISEHHWTATGSGSWDTPLNWTFGLGPRGLIPTFVDPAQGALITGPAGTTAIKSLMLGTTQSGIAELQMAASSQLNVSGATVVTARGRLDLAGVLNSGGGLDNSGVLAVNGSVQVGAQLTNRQSGEVRLAAGQHLTVTGTGSSNAGVMDLTGGELEFTNGLTNVPSTGLITARNASLRFGLGQLTNAGSLALVAGTSDLYGKIVNTGTIAVSGGVGGGTQTAIFHDDVVQNGALSVSASGNTHSIAVFLGSYSGAGGITGGGDVFFQGDLRPGNSPASVTYAANISLSNTAVTTMELGGRVLGSQYDHLAVNGAFTLGGALDVVLLNGFTPQAGDTFDLFDFDPAQRLGNFGSVNLPALSPGLSWQTSQLLSSGQLTVVPEPAAALLLTSGLSLAGFRRRTCQARSLTSRL